MKLPSPPTQILVIRGGAIGDFILTLPVLAALRRRFLDSRIEVLGYPQIAELAVVSGLADAVNSIESPSLSQLFVASGQIAEPLARFFGRFQLVISYIYDPGRIFEHNVRRLAGATYLRGVHRPDENPLQHATATLLEPLRAIGIDSPDPVPRLSIPGVDRSHSSIGVPMLAVHPGSGSERKNWPENSWAQLLDRLARMTEWRLLMIGGEAETGRIDRLARHWPNARLELAVNLPLTSLASRMASAAAFVGHDSGITHLAAAVGLPTLVLWGPTNSVVWRPLGHHVRIIKAPDKLEALPVEAVTDACIDLMRTR